MGSGNQGAAPTTAIKQENNRVKREPRIKRESPPIKQEPANHSRIKTELIS